MAVSNDNFKENGLKPGAERRKIGKKRKIAFVCSGGAAKAGAFHLGVALALQEHGFQFYGGVKTEGDNQQETQSLEKNSKMMISTYVGSSAGSIISCYLASGYSLANIFNSFLGRTSDDPIDNFPKPLAKLTYPKMFKLRPGLAREQLAQALSMKKMIADFLRGDWESFVEFKWLKTTGFFSTGGIEEHMREEVLPSNRFQDFLPELFIVGTQLNHSRKMVFGKYRYEPPPHDLSCEYENHVAVSDACAASTALPPVFSPYLIETHTNGVPQYYIDGEIRETLSTHVAVDAGADLIFSSHTHQPYHFNPETGSLTNYGLPAILVQSIYLLIEQKINNHIHSKQVQKNAIDAVEAYCIKEGVSEAHRKKIIQILEAELHQRRDVDTIYIHPSPNDSKMFFSEHFSLSPKTMTETVRSGFRAAIQVLKQYDFEDRVVEHVSVDLRKKT